MLCLYVVLSAEERIVLPDASTDESLLTPEERIAVLAQPRLSELQNMTCHISESIEFKVSIITY